MKIFVINLKRSEDRRIAISEKFARYNISAEFFDAIDGNLLSEELMLQIHSGSNMQQEIWGEGTKMTRGEVGVALSHMGIYKKLADDNIDYAFILEDDADFDDRLSHILLNTKKMSVVMDRFDLVLLGYCRNDLNYKRPAQCSIWGGLKLDKIIKVGVPIHWYWSAIGYIISQRGAKILLSHNEIPQIQADVLTANSPAYGIRLGIFKSPIIWESILSKDSTIQDRKENPAMGSGSERRSFLYNQMQKINKIAPIEASYFKTRAFYHEILKKAKVTCKRISPIKYSFTIDTNKPESKL